MEKELNIAEILKDKPKGLKLWSDTFGELFVDCIDEQNDAFPIYLTVRYGNKICLTKDGCYYSDETGTLPCIVPSKSMRDWSKFAWKKGDVLTDNATTICMFDSWANDDYTEFNAKYTLHLIASSNKESEVCKTNDFVPVVKDEDKQSYLATAETYFNVNLTKGSMWIEKPQYKEGDIVQIGDDTFVILKEIEPYKASYHYYYKDGITNFNDSVNIAGQSLKLASKADQLTILSHLKEYFKKQWDAEKKAIVDLPKKCELKPMDWCLMKYKGQYNNRCWELCQYAYTEHRVSYLGRSRDFYHSVGGEIYAECIPYNDQTAHLLGTTDDWKGGEA